MVMRKIGVDFVREGKTMDKKGNALIYHNSMTSIAEHLRVMSVWFKRHIEIHEKEPDEEACVAALSTEMALKGLISHMQAKDPVLFCDAEKLAHE